MQAIRTVPSVSCLSRASRTAGLAVRQSRTEKYAVLRGVTTRARSDLSNR